MLEVVGAIRLLERLTLITMAIFPVAMMNKGNITDEKSNTAGNVLDIKA